MERGLVDHIIDRLLHFRNGPGKHIPLLEGEIRQLCLVSSGIFLAQSNLLELKPPINICGDIHGQFSDLLRHFDNGGYPPTADYLFLGDYVDRGQQGLETMCLLLAYKIKFPNSFYLLRGNHECASINEQKHGFREECERKFNSRLWRTFTECFNCLPAAAIVGEKIFCVHGGISPKLHNLDQIRSFRRPVDVLESDLLCDLLWSDPRDIQGWVENTKRNVGYIFGAGEVTEFLQKHDLDLICRGHESAEDGYKFFANRQLITIFSAPGYSEGNAGAMLIVDRNLVCTFQILEPLGSGSTGAAN